MYLDMRPVCTFGKLLAAPRILSPSVEFTICGWVIHSTVCDETYVLKTSIIFVLQ